MKEQNATGHENRYITIWLMKDRTADYIQYRINVHKIKQVAVGVVVSAFILSFFSLMIGLAMGSDRPESGLIASSGQAPLCVPLASSDPEGPGQLQSAAVAFTQETVLPMFQIGLKAMEFDESDDPRPKAEELAKLNQRLIDLEARLQRDTNKTRELAQCMEKDLARWVPQGSAGGDEELDSGPPGAVGGPASGPAEWDAEGGWSSGTEMPSSSFAQVESIKTRLARLDKNLNSYELSMDDLAGAWGDRNIVFSAFPTYWPVSTGKISSPFGMRIHPISGQFKLHTGLDIDTEWGSPIFAASAGVVTYAESRRGYGNTVIIDHGYGISTLYAHCSTLQVNSGEAVEKGQKIAEVGSTGLSTGPHLHFEIRILGVPVDPMNYLIAFTPEAD